MTARATTTGRARTQARRTTAANGTSPVPQYLRFTKRPAEPAQVPAFEIDGEIFTMPERVEATDALALTGALNTVPTEGGKLLVLVRELCGNAALKALLEDASVTVEQLTDLKRFLSDHALGQLEAMPGN
jgi:hypothetical protein